MNLQAVLEQRAKVEEFQRKHRIGLLTLLFTDLVGSTKLKSANRTMTCEDSLIAATALFHGHTVATRNKRHFEPAGVPVIDPLA